MDFLFTDEQAALREMSRDMFATLYPPSRLRELWEGAERDPQAWRTMAGAGLTGLLIPQEQGGFGGTAVDLLVVLEEAGGALVPDPLADTAAVAVAGLLDAPQAVAQRWLPAIASGDALVAVQLDGQPFVGDADMADLLLVQRGDRLEAVDRDGFACTRVQTEDRTRRLFAVDPGAGTPAGPAAPALRIGRLATAAQLNGIAAALLEQTLAYAKVREQFGVPIGSFQAVKHKLASVFATLESSRAAAQLAALALATDQPDADTACLVAKAHAARAQALANTEALQCHAGIGFTWEHDLHFWLKRGRALEHAFGSPREHRAAIAAALLD